MGRIKKGMIVESRRSGIRREVVGFTKKPDGQKRAKLQHEDRPDDVTVALVDSISKNYAIV
jgi:hypothetical protein